MLNIAEEEYVAFENGQKYPDSETLKRLCMMMEWNYHDIQRMINNEQSTQAIRNNPAMPDSASRTTPVEALQSVPLNNPTAKSSKSEKLGTRLREVRQATGQTMDIIAMLLNIDQEAYQRMEEGELPNDDILRRISMVYDWNYHDLLALLRSQQATSLQPRRTGTPFPGRSPHLQKAKDLLSQIEQALAGVPEQQHPLIISQLELILETLRRQATPSIRPAPML